jgi:hypothetical protein
LPEKVSPPRATRPLGDISQRSTAPAPNAPVGDPVPAMGPRLMACPGVGCGSCGSATLCAAAASAAGANGRAPDLGAGGTRLPTRLRGVGFFNAVLACAADGTFFTAALACAGDGTFFAAATVFSADEAFFGGFVSNVAVRILIPSLVGAGCRSLTGEAV